MREMLALASPSGVEVSGVVSIGWEKVQIEYLTSGAMEMQHYMQLWQ
ncbi:hypothetical protein KP509_10G023300 [Ceratopteris richardii]|uniref:Uncharacterized protein n=1 Tax=Ceratopteris richardii TaxID=49495 RepID=A0A8T2TVR1_CERRI|nr:hypothetical protein KP509_10G023300 [Ceratopteris richardii]